MDDVEIMMNARKGVDEHKTLKALGKFLKRDQEKDVDDQLPADVLHQLQQVRDSLEVGPLVLSPLAASLSPSPTPQQTQREQEDDGGEAAGAEADEQEHEHEQEPPKSEKKRKKKRHKKE